MIPSTENDLLRFLDSLGIDHHTVHHDPVYTTAQSAHLYDQLKGGHFKTLLVKDRKGHAAMVVMAAELRVDLQRVAQAIGAGRLSFASETRLYEMLGVRPGSVTPFALINRRQSPENGPQPFHVILDESLMAWPLVNFHPLHNGATTGIARDDLLHFIRACGFRPQITNVQAR